MVKWNMRMTEKRDIDFALIFGFYQTASVSSCPPWPCMSPIFRPLSSMIFLEDSTRRTSGRSQLPRTASTWQSDWRYSITSNETRSPRCKIISSRPTLSDEGFREDMAFGQMSIRNDPNHNLALEIPPISISFCDDPCVDVFYAYEF